MFHYLLILSVTLSPHRGLHSISSFHALPLTSRNVCAFIYIHMHVYLYICMNLCIIRWRFAEARSQILCVHSQRCRTRTKSLYYILPVYATLTDTVRFYHKAHTHSIYLYIYIHLTCHRTQKKKKIGLVCRNFKGSNKKLLERSQQLFVESHYELYIQWCPHFLTPPSIFPFGLSHSTDLHGIF